MPLRIIQDEQGRTWHVWGVQPSDIMRQVGESVASQSPDAQRQRRAIAVDPRWADGWLTFETHDEKRRLAPYPTEWTGLSDYELSELCAKAVSVQPSRAQPSWVGLSR